MGLTPAFLVDLDEDKQAVDEAVDPLEGSELLIIAQKAHQKYWVDEYDPERTRMGFDISDEIKEIWGVSANEAKAIQQIIRPRKHK